MKTVDTLQSLVMCYFSTTAPATNALNRSATARAIDAAGAAKKAARLYNTVVAAKGTAVGKAISLQQRTGVAIRKLGLPIRIGGIYLPIRRISDAQNIFDDATAELDVIREDILATYPDTVKDVEGLLAGFASEVSIPSATEIAARFTMGLTILNQPVPVGDLKGVVGEVANRVRAESKQQASAMLREAHAGPIVDLKRQLAEFTDALRNAQRLHHSQFDKLRDEVKRVRELNVLDLPEVDEVARLADIAARSPLGDLSTHERVSIAQQAERASEKADETLAALGL
jgi:hypothetical protein